MCGQNRDNPFPLDGTMSCLLWQNTKDIGLPALAAARQEAFGSMPLALANSTHLEFPVLSEPSPSRQLPHQHQTVS